MTNSRSVQFYVSFFQDLKTTIQFSVLGLTFALGRIVYDFANGSIFVFFKHPFDVGDRVNVFNAQETQSAPLIVKRLSLLYVIFERIDDKSETQYPNIRLSERRVDNLSRSGLNRQVLTLDIDVTTTFKDIQLLRGQMQDFLNQRGNARDYRPELGLTVSSISSMAKMELTISVFHKSNWSNEALRAYRASRFLCALVAAVRRVPIARPGGGPPFTGDEAKPSYQVIVTEDEAARKRNAHKSGQLKKRVDYVPPKPEADTALSTAVSPLVTPGTATSEQEDEEAKAKAEQAEKEEEERLQKEQEEQAAMTDFTAIPLERRPTAGASRPTDSDDVRAGTDTGALSEYPFISVNEVGARRSPREVPEGTDESYDSAPRYGIAR